MKLTFLGATHEVTGSCYYLEACGKKILIDYGMEQGRDVFVNRGLPVSAHDIDMVLITHAHIDHSGLLPLLAKQGFAGQIFCTESTHLLCRIMLMDSAHIQEMEAEWRNRKAERAGRVKVEPLYTTEDALDALSYFVGVPYNEEKYIADGLRIRFVDAGHLLGSASIEVWITEDGIEKKIVFSGDIGNLDQPIIKDPTYLTEADYVVMESTYAGRLHEKPADYARTLAGELQLTFDRGGNVVIPAFSVGRTQEMLYYIRKIKQDHLVKGHDGFEVYVDSPLAVEATGVFMKRMYTDFDEEAGALIREGINPISFDGLHTAVTTEESRAINDDPKPKVIISASGMCDAGRIRHHLKHNLYRADSTVLFVGYQSEGTLGRLLVDGADHVRLFSEDITVRARVQVLPGISGHADDAGLTKWITSFNPKPAMVFVTHGEDAAVTLFQEKLEKELQMSAYAPYSGTIFDLASGQFVREMPGERIQKKDALETGQISAHGRHVGTVYAHLVDAGSELIALIRTKSGMPNADLKRFIRDIRDLIEKWK